MDLRANSELNSLPDAAKRTKTVSDVTLPMERKIYGTGVKPKRRRRSVTFNLSPEVVHVHSHSQRAVVHKQTRQRPRMTLRKEFNVVGCIVILIGTVVGGGIFGQPNLAAKRLDSIPVTLIMWAFTGIFVIICALVYAEIGTTFPVSGADYSYLLIFYGPAVAAMHLFTTAFFIMPNNIAALAVIAGRHLLRALPAPAPFPDAMLDFDRAAACLGIVIIIIAMSICCSSTHLVSQVASVHLICKIGTAMFLVVLGVVYLGKHNFRPASLKDWGDFQITPQVCEGACGNLRKNRSDVTVIDEIHAVAQAFSGIYVSFYGMEAPTFIIEELTEPETVLPKGMFISMSIIAVLYVVLNVCYLIVLSKPEYLTNVDGVANEVLRKVVGTNSVAVLLPILVALSMFGTLVLRLHCCSRVPFVGTRNGHFPKFFSLIHYKRLTPIPSLIFLGLLAIVYASLGIHHIGALASATSFFWKLGLCLILVGNIRLRLKEPAVVRPFKIPLALQLVSLVVLICVLLDPYLSADWTFKRHYKCGWEERVIATSSLGGAALMYPFYYFFIKRQWTGNRLEKALVFAENRVTIFLQKTFLLVEEDCGCEQ